MQPVRVTFEIKHLFIEIPGPGEYMAPSEFGHYESRVKYNSQQSPRGLAAENNE
jgi:hypothetical protein